MGVNILKAKSLSKGNILIVFKEGDVADDYLDTKEYPNARPHEDLISSMQNLRVHVAILGGYKTTKDLTFEKGKKGDPKRPVLSEEDFDAFKCLGFNISNRGVGLVGQRSVPLMEKLVHFNAAIVNFAAEGEAAYEYVDDFKAKIERAKKEFELFMGGKRGKDPQLALPGMSEAELSKK